MRIGTLLSDLAAGALDLLFPPRCVGCGAFGSYLCSACTGAMPRALPPRCAHCWRPQPQGQACLRCRQEPPSLAAARCPFTFEGTARAAVHALKYQGLAAIAPTMADLMAAFLRDHPQPADLIVPVPLFPRRQRQRGYNQAALLAKELSPRLGLPLAKGALMRRRPTPPQARSVDLAARRANVAGAFAADAAQVAGRRLLLIDDVMTTGATLDACGRALLDAGAVAVFALTFARED